MPVPVLLLAFANDRESGARYLRHLPEERRALRAALKRGDDAGRWETVVLPDATLDDLLGVFQDPRYRDRVALVHYGGHADSFGLLLEVAGGRPAIAGARGLAAFLGQQPSLACVVLNGCSTAGQVQELTDAGVPAVVATAREIDDLVATEFAARLYQGLAGGTTLQRAYAEASAALQTSLRERPRGWRRVEADVPDHKSGAGSVAPSRPVTASTAFVPPALAGARAGQTRDVGGLNPSDGLSEDRGWPWALTVRDSAAGAIVWSLGTAAGDPLWGLPPLPDEVRHPPPEQTSPFRHLLPYERAHAALFFGRDREIRALYERVLEPQYPPLTLLYGPSGAGKSSLLAAGLLPRLERTYATRYTRRDGQIPLRETLVALLTSDHVATHAGGEFRPPIADAAQPAPADAWRETEARLSRPLLVILDQIDEVFTRAPQRGVPRAHRELDELVDSLVPLFRDRRAHPRGRLVLALRNEWVPEVERILQSARLTYGRVSLSRLDRDGIVEAILGPTRTPELRARYGLSVADGIPEVIADELLKDPGAPVAPTLQVLLATLWARATARNREAPLIDRRLYESLRREGLLLDDFVEKQLARISEVLPEDGASGLLLDLLAFHTSPLGVAETRTRAELLRTYTHVADRLPALITQGVAGHLLVESAADVGAAPTGSTTDEASALPPATRLVHDTLAPLIRRSYDSSDRVGQRARRLIETRAREWRNAGRGRTLDAEDFATVSAGVRGMREMTDDERHLVRQGQLAAQLHHAETTVARAAALQDATEALRLVMTLTGGPEPPGGAALAARLAALARPCPEPRGHTSSVLPADAEPSVFHGCPMNIESAAFTADGRRVATGGIDGRVHVWVIGSDERPVLLGDYRRTVRALAFSADGTRVFVVTEGGTAYVIPADGSGRSITLHGRARSLRGAAFSSDARYVASACADGGAHIWGADGTSAPVVRGAAGAGSTTVRFSPDAKFVAVGGMDGAVRVWPVEGEGVPTVLSAGNSPVYACGFSPGGAHLVAGSADGAVRIWRTDGVGVPTLLRESGSSVRVVAFSQDDEHVACGCMDGAVRVWRLATSQHPIRLHGHSSAVRAIGFLPDQQRLISTAPDGTVRIWRIGWKPLLEHLLRVGSA